MGLNLVVKNNFHSLLSKLLHESSLMNLLIVTDEKKSAIFTGSSESWFRHFNIQ